MISASSQQRIPTCFVLPVKTTNREIKVNEKDFENRTALHLASSSGHKAVVEILLSHSDIKVNEKNNQGKTAFEVARTEAIKKLIKERMIQNSAT